jgi:hypothetical protein
MTALSIGVFIADCAEIYGEPAYKWVAGEQMFIGRTYNEGNMILRILIPLAAAIPMSDVFFMERRNEILSATLPRFKSRGRYFRATAAAVFTAAFLIVLIPMLINALLVAVAFPYSTLKDFSNVPTGDTWRFAAGIEKEVPWFGLLLKAPHLYNVFTSFLASVFSGAAGVFAYAFSFLIRKNRTLVYVVFFIVHQLLEILSFSLEKFGFNISLLGYLFPYSNAGGKTLPAFLIVLFALLLMVFALCFFGRRKIKDAL